ncbi:hypothetical protein CH381_23605 [Leptospira sp. mixed culture ATI2-C-A1]|nr:hypothetical protein CH358_07005 [Leptospira meyeri]PKA23864.1 hypothetical protein CH381_23605 [Leptospira sp. mixed culture ATI2-C-A1]
MRQGYGGLGLLAETDKRRERKANPGVARSVFKGNSDLLTEWRRPFRKETDVSQSMNFFRKYFFEVWIGVASFGPSW